MAESLLSVLVEMLATLGRVLWLIAAAIVSFFLPTRPKDVSKEVVLVTGAASGIGRLIALEFAALGAKVVLWDVNQEANDALADEIKEKGQAAFAFHCDLSKREDIYKTAAQVKRDVGDVTVLVNNAGVVSGKKFFEVPDDLAQLTFQVNTVAHFWTIKAFVPAMMAKNHGHVITVASTAGLFGVASLTDYCSSKFGAVGIHESLTSELVTLKHTGVHTTCVCPYYINTGMFDGVKTRFPLLLPILKPEYAVKKIMSAYHSNQRMMIMPRICYIFYFLQGLLPKSALLEMGDFLGVNQSMDTFRGRVKQD